NKPSTLATAAPKPAPPPAPFRAAPQPAPGPAGVRRFEMEEDGTRYFWEIEADGQKHRVRFGTFETKVKTFDSEQECREALVSRVQDKLSNGFVEVETD